MYLMFYDTLLRWDYSIAYSILKLIPKQNKKKWKTIFWKQKMNTQFSYPRNIIEFKNYLNDCKGSEQN